MTMIGAISLACLLITGTLSTWAVFSQHFDDTMLQRAGLSIVSIACASRAVERMSCAMPDPPPTLLAAQIGLALYATGTALKLIRKAHQQAERRQHHRRWRGV